jgi:hypothetical protein
LCFWPLSPPLHTWQVINWAFGLLLSAAAHALPTSSAAAGSSGAAVAGVACDGKPLVALTGLMRVLWHCTYVEGLPVQLRGVLLVAMALRNLLLVVALPVWARKAVAAQLRAWQEGISEAHACNPVLHTGDAKLVHLLRVLSEVGQRLTAFLHPPLNILHELQLHFAQPTAQNSHHPASGVTASFDVICTCRRL